MELSFLIWNVYTCVIEITAALCKNMRKIPFFCFWYKTITAALRYTIFATHMESLSQLATIYPNVKIVHFDVDIKNKRMDFKVKKAK